MPLSRSPQQDPVSTQIMLTAKKVRTSRRFGSSVGESIKITLEREDSLRLIERGVKEVIMELEAYVFTQRLAESTFTIPYSDAVEAEHWATWWDQFKAEEIAPLRLWGWIARRWPPQTVIVETWVRGQKILRLEREAMFPEANYAFPPEATFGRPVWVEHSQVFDSEDLVHIETKVR